MTLFPARMNTAKESYEQDHSCTGLGARSAYVHCSICPSIHTVCPDGHADMDGHADAYEYWAAAGRVLLGGGRMPLGRRRAGNEMEVGVAYMDGGPGAHQQRRGCSVVPIVRLLHRRRQCEPRGCRSLVLEWQELDQAVCIQSRHRGRGAFCSQLRIRDKLRGGGIFGRHGSGRASGTVCREVERPNLD